MSLRSELAPLSRARTQTRLPPLRLPAASNSHAPEARNGSKKTVPRGVIYVITGAGGATLHDPGRQQLPQTWLEFTERLVSNVYSFTLLEVERDRLLLCQVDESGTVIDTFTVTRPGP